MFLCETKPVIWPQLFKKKCTKAKCVMLSLNAQLACQQAGVRDGFSVRSDAQYDEKRAVDAVSLRVARRYLKLQ